MYRFSRHVCLERRRLTRIGVLAFISGFVLYSHIDLMQLGLPFPLFAGLFYLVAIVVAASVTTFVFPKLRRLTDAIALSRFGFALWILGTNDYELLASPTVSATIVVASAIILLRASDVAIGWERYWATVVDWVGSKVRANSLHSWLDNNVGARGLQPSQVVVVQTGRLRT